MKGQFERGGVWYSYPLMLLLLAVFGATPQARASTRPLASPVEDMALPRAEDLSASVMRTALAQTTSFEFDAAAIANIGKLYEEGACTQLVSLAQRQVDRDARSLMAHYVLSRCKATQGQKAEADKHAAQLPVLMEEMKRPSGAFGEDRLIAARSFVDCIAYIAIGHWDVVSETFEIRNGGWRLYDKVTARRLGDDHDVVLRFDLTDYAHDMVAAASTQFPSDQSKGAMEAPALYMAFLFSAAPMPRAAALTGLADFHEGMLHDLITKERSLELLRRALQSDDPYPKYAVGRRLLLKSQGDADFAKAREYLEAAAAEGMNEAQVLLAAMYAGGFGVETSNTRRDQQLDRAAKHLGTPRMEYEYANVLRDDDLHVANPAEGMRWLRRSAEHGYAPAQNDYGTLCAQEGDAKKPSCDVDWYTRSIAKGNVVAMCNLGDLYQSGRGVTVDFAKAKTLYERSVAGGNVACDAKLGNLYYRGDGVQRDYASALRYYEMGAEWGEAVAQNNLAIVYRDGEGIERNDAEALKWTRRAAIQGYPRGASGLAYLYETGRGVDHNDQTAAALYAYAAVRGYDRAQYQLCAFYTEGRGVAKDLTRAAHWCRLAAEQGNADAMSGLGYAYEKGEGVVKDPKQAVD
ncbi:hypothetical protein GCM10009105_13350 [Dokdonella soli]|uniref:Sel1 repeat family protein n=1 Tax=Dokdonella soli TaxID=529810 RepID=A0ABN1IF17_9GAMM